MIWLQSPQWSRWLVSVLIACAALWVEFGPDPSRDHPFAVEHIGAGELIGPSNTEMRKIPSDLLPRVEPGGYALRDFEPDEPLTVAGVSPYPHPIPRGWWSIAIDIPADAVLGGQVQVVLLDTGATVPGVVSAVSSDDPLLSATGAVAVSPDYAAAAALAAAEGRAVVLVGTG